MTDLRTAHAVRLLESWITDPANEPWEDFGIDREERCFFCKSRRTTIEHPSGDHMPDCFWKLMTDLFGR